MKSWKKVSIKKIASMANVGTATVDRVLYNREGVKKETKLKVLQAIKYLENGIVNKKKIFLLCQSGHAYNNTLKSTLNDLIKKNIDLEVDSEFILTKNNITEKIENKILQNNLYDGLIIVSTENHIINNIIQDFNFKNKPSITLTSDLSGTDRTAYIGNDQVAAGATAANLLTSLIHPNKKGEVLMVISQPFKCQQERELGFKKIIRYDFPKITIKDGLQTTDTSEESYKQIKKYIQQNGPPLGIYNITGGNLGIADAIKDTGFKRVPFVGHEINSITKNLLINDRISYIISHNIKYELAKSFQLIDNYYDNLPLKDIKTNILIFNKYNCPDDAKLY